MPELDDLRSRFKARLPGVIEGLRAKAADHDAPPREAGYSIRNAAGDEAVVRIYDEIWFLGVNALDFAADLDQITAPKMRVEINSPGGDVWDGIAIYNALRNHPAEVTTRVDGIAASIASVIAQAGDRRIMMSGSQMMIHNAWGLTVGDHNDHEDMARVLAHQDTVIAQIYASRAGSDVDGFRDLMEAETWMTAEQAVEHGLADEVLNPDRVSDSTPTLHDKISDAVSAVKEATTSAETVIAVRAEAGKPLSNVNVESLNGLHDTIGGLLDLFADPVEQPAEYAEKKQAASKRAAALRTL